MSLELPTQLHNAVMGLFCKKLALTCPLDDFG